MILVTGGTGLVGAHLLFKLASEHKTIRAVYRNKNTLENTKNVFSCYTENYAPLFESIEWVEADILDIPALTEAFKDITEVYHCAALVSFDPNKYHLLRKTNIEGTANVVNLSIANNIKKFCYVSSVATLGSNLDNEPITEGTYWNPEADNSVYAITKYGAEMEVWRGTQEGLNAVIVNPSVIIGSGIWESGTGSLFEKAHQGIGFYTSGSIALVDVEDVVSIMILLMNSPVKNERFVLVGECWPYKKFLQTITQAVNSKPPKKLASLTLLNIIWRLDWLKTKLTGKPRQLTKQLAKSLSTKHNYSNKKIRKTLNYEFKDMAQSIKTTANQYLK